MSHSRTNECLHLGAEYNPFAGPHLLDPYPFFARLREEAPVSYNPMLGMWLVSRYEDVRLVLADQARFSSADLAPQGSHLIPEAQALLGDIPLVGANPLNTDPPLHDRLRRLIRRGFTPASVAAQEPTIQQFARELVEGFVSDGRADLAAQLAYPLPLRVILHMTGVPREDMEQVKRWCDDWFALAFAQVPAEKQVDMVRSVLAYRSYCAALIEERRKNPREDLATWLAQAEPDGERLTDEELVPLLGASLIAAGHETTAVLIAFCLRMLLEVPERWQLVRERRELLPAVLEECMRYDSPSTGMVRTAKEDVEIAGVFLPKGSRLFLLYAAANRDGCVMEEPDRFNPDRPRFQHLNFGHGLHYCLGASLARLEVQTAVTTLLDLIPDLRLIPGQDLGYAHPLLLLRGLTRLPVEWG